MTAFLVSWIDGDDSFPYKIYVDKGKAKEFVKEMNETTEIGWVTEELEVIE
jgi:hypothetical protein